MPKTKTEEDLLVEFIGDTISPESALLACSINLMRAGDIAKQMQDTESLLKVSKAWYELARYLSGDKEEDKTNPIGFTTLEVDIDEPGDGAYESEGGIEVRSKSRKL
jgi:hypothetical protein